MAFIACDQLARTVAVNMITFGQVFYLLNSRYLLDSSLSLRAHLGNKYLSLGIGAVVVLQLLFTYAPPLQRLFDTEAVPLRYGRGSFLVDWCSPPRGGGETHHPFVELVAAGRHRGGSWGVNSACPGSARSAQGKAVSQSSATLFRIAKVTLVRISN
jgi:hypothetical protein